MSASVSPAKPDILRELVFPPMPEALVAIRNERAKSAPDLGRIAQAVSADVSLAAEVLKAVNSPAFGLRRTISSIPNAVLLLGLDNVVNVVNSVALRAQLSSVGQLTLNRFWDTATDVALASAKVAKEYTGVPPDMAYSMGLFHDCGIPLLMARFRDYGPVLKRAITDGWRITDAEQRHFGIQHAAIGYHVSHAWRMPEELSQAILYHHNFNDIMAGSGGSDDVRALVAVLKIAEHVSDRFRGLAFRRAEEDGEWGSVREQVLDYLAIGDLEYDDLEESLITLLGRR